MSLRWFTHSAPHSTWDALLQSSVFAEDKTCTRDISLTNGNEAVALPLMSCYSNLDPVPFEDDCLMCKSVQDRVNSRRVCRRWQGKSCSHTAIKNRAALFQSYGARLSSSWRSFNAQANADQTDIAYPNQRDVCVLYLRPRTTPIFDSSGASNPASWRALQIAAEAEIITPPSKRASAACWECRVIAGARVRRGVFTTAEGSGAAEVRGG